MPEVPDQESKEFNPQIPDGLSRVILKCLEKNKTKRYQDISGICSDLENVEKGVPATAKDMPEQKPITAAIPGMRWKSSVAVLPFADISPQKDQEYFCDGMTDDIITKLTELQDLKVISKR